MTPKTELPPPAIMDAIKCLNIKQVSETVGMPISTIQKRKKSGDFPKPSFKIGKANYWRAERIRTWLDQCERRYRMGV